MCVNYVDGRSELSSFSTGLPTGAKKLSYSCSVVPLNSRRISFSEFTESSKSSYSCSCCSWNFGGYFSKKKSLLCGLRKPTTTLLYLDVQLQKFQKFLKKSLMKRIAIFNQIHLIQRGVTTFLTEIATATELSLKTVVQLQWSDVKKNSVVVAQL